jgi:hypothetical protein
MNINDFRIVFILKIYFQEANNYVEDLIRPVVPSCTDQDSRVRFYACEALYNICKVCRGFVLPFFNEIFDGVSKVCLCMKYMYILSLICFARMNFSEQYHTEGKVWVRGCMEKSISSKIINDRMFTEDLVS